jgi:SAM-dependent methyltransferase
VVNTVPPPPSLLRRALRRAAYGLVLARLGAGRPVPASALDAEYAGGRWDHFGGAAEAPRYAALTRLVRATATQPRLLDVGCGSGALAACFGPDELGGYLGTDLSAEGLARARALGLPHGNFVQGDFETWRPPAGTAWDAIVFNEVIGYARWPGRLVRDFGRWLAPGGRIVISYYRAHNFAAIWRAVERGWHVAHTEELRDTEGRVWDLRTLAASANLPEAAP